MQVRSELLHDKEIVFHPDRSNGSIRIYHPTKETEDIDWLYRNRIATITPKYNLSTYLTIRLFQENNFEKQQDFYEPDFLFNTNAAGTVIEEEYHERVWVIHPTNQYKGLNATFPKGRIEKGHSSRETAIKETLEETGLKVVLTSFLCDITTKNNSVIRYYRAKRVGGHPKDMGWETQAVSLVPKEQLREVLHSKDDQLILDKILRD